MQRMRSPLDTSTLLLAALALVLAAVAYLKDPGLPVLGAKAGLSMLAFVLPRMVVALRLRALCRCWCPRTSCLATGGFRGIVIATVAGMVTPGGPMVTVPFMVVLANSGAALPALVAYMTSWSLFGVQRIIAWEAPLLGWPFVFARVVPSLAFPVIAGWLVSVCHSE